MSGVSVVPGHGWFIDTRVALTSSTRGGGGGIDGRMQVAPPRHLFALAKPYGTAGVSAGKRKKKRGNSHPEAQRHKAGGTTTSSTFSTPAHSQQTVKFSSSSSECAAKAMRIGNGACTAAGVAIDATLGTPLEQQQQQQQPVQVFEDFFLGACLLSRSTPPMLWRGR